MYLLVKINKTGQLILSIGKLFVFMYLMRGNQFQANPFVSKTIMFYPYIAHVPNCQQNLADVLVNPI